MPDSRFKHFGEDNEEYTHKVPNGDVTTKEIPRATPKLKYEAIPCIPTRLFLLFKAIFPKA